MYCVENAPQRRQALSRTLISFIAPVARGDWERKGKKLLLKVANFLSRSWSDQLLVLLSPAPYVRPIPLPHFHPIHIHYLLHPPTTTPSHSHAPPQNFLHLKIEQERKKGGQKFPTKCSPSTPVKVPTCCCCCPSSSYLCENSISCVQRNPLITILSITHNIIPRAFSRNLNERVKSSVNSSRRLLEPPFVMNSEFLLNKPAG